MGNALVNRIQRELYKLMQAGHFSAAEYAAVKKSLLVLC